MKISLLKKELEACKEALEAEGDGTISYIDLDLKIKIIDKIDKVLRGKNAITKAKKG